MSKYTKAKRKWVDKNVYSFTVDNGREYSSLFYEELIVTENSVKSSYVGSLSSDFEQLKNKISGSWFSGNFWIAREFAMRSGYKFSFERKVI